MTEINPDRIREIIKNFKDKKVLIVGDIMLDKYIWGNVKRISPEAPVPIVEVINDTSCLGGAGNVAFNLEMLGATPILVGQTGNDAEGEWIKNNLKDSRGVFTEENKPTTVKTRIIAHHQQVVRVDMERSSELSQHTEKQMFDFIQKEKYGGIIISDYDKGTLSRSLMRNVLAFAQQKEIPVIVDPKVNNFFHFSPVRLITPNHLEVEKIVHFPCHTDGQVEKAGQKIISMISTQYLIIKRGEQGMTVFEKGKRSLHIPTQAKEVYDVTGAGDTVAATAALALLAGASIREAAWLANAAAGIVVGKIGTAALNSEELTAALVVN